MMLSLSLNFLVSGVYILFSNKFTDDATNRVQSRSYSKYGNGYLYQDILEVPKEILVRYGGSFCSGFFLMCHH